MPTLNWIGKDKVINHHLDVPVRTLKKEYTFSPDGSNDGNMIVHGDNLEALKALLPQYERRIRCIYIDPPYNTGNEGWVYNDNVNDPRIQKWLGKTVGMEGEDLSRHDKWLCMMYPRLRLLQKMLSEDGVIFVSIDDIEVNYLRQIMDEIYGKSNFIAQLIWKSRQNKDNRNITHVSVDHEYVLCYGKALKGCSRKEGQYSNPDNDPRGPWTSANMAGLATEEARPNLHYDLIDPATGINYGRPTKGWRYDRNTMARLIEEKRILWPPTPDGRPRKKQFLSDLTTDTTGYSSIIGNGIFTRDGTNEQFNIWGRQVFDFPKYSGFVQELIEQATEPDSIILDSFAGSGTTAHAVLKMNKADGGHRKFILVEMGDYADSITAERVRRVINGYGEGKNIVEGTGGSFSFYELGESLFLPDGMLNPEAAMDDIRAYVYYSETRAAIDDPSIDDPFFLGVHDNTAYYFCYNPDQQMVLSDSLLGQLRHRGDQYVIYADACAVSDNDLKRWNITFKKIPRDIARF